MKGIFGLKFGILHFAKGILLEGEGQWFGGSHTFKLKFPQVFLSSIFTSLVVCITCYCPWECGEGEWLGGSYTFYLEFPQGFLSSIFTSLVICITCYCPWLPAVYQVLLNGSAWVWSHTLYFWWFQCWDEWVTSVKMFDSWPPTVLLHWSG